MKYFFVTALFFASFPIQAATVLVLVAHPDDELSVNGTILHMVNTSLDVHVAYSTSGKYGNDVRGIANTPAKLGQQRESEATEALGVLGVEPSNIHFMRQDDNGANIYAVVASVQPLFDTLQPDIVITFGVEGIYGHADHRNISAVTSYIFNNAINSKILLHLAISETKDSGYGFTRDRRTPSDNTVYRVADYAINYQLNVAAYAETQKASLRKYVSQFDADKIAIMSRYYETAQCPDGTVCEQFVLARVKNNIGNTTSDLLRLINFTPVNQP
ncbi:MAG: PIG-L family deacetylase [Gammaproteobacteria bacterium]|nr:PIG-L family deacetylase [Gammaproteobacteria bacterium]